MKKKRRKPHNYNHWPLKGQEATCYECGILITSVNKDDLCNGPPNPEPEKHHEAPDF